MCQKESILQQTYQYFPTQYHHFGILLASTYGPMNERIQLSSSSTLCRNDSTSRKSPASTLHTIKEFWPATLKTLVYGKPLQK